MFIQPWREKYFSGEPLRIGEKPQYLFDDYIVEDRFGLRRVTGPVEKYAGNPLKISPSLPWEQSVSLSNILYDPDEKLYKAWYGFLKPRCPGDKYEYVTCYAGSKDGMAWEKPEFDYYPYSGRSKTNIVFMSDDDTAMILNISMDLSASDAGSKFTAIAKTVPPGQEHRCIVRLLSPDGRKWSFATDPIIFKGASDGSYSVVRDYQRSLWLMFRRPPTRAFKPEGIFKGANTKRRVSVCQSVNFKNWTHPRTLAIPDDIDVSDVDSVKVIKLDDVFIGFIGLMDNPAVLPKHTHLMWSRDGYSWERLPDRPRFILNGEPGEWDAGWITVSTLIPEGDRIRIYYHGGNAAQAEDKLKRIGATGIAFIGRDRFVGQQAGPYGGYLLTRQFILEGNKIEINYRSQVERPPAPDMGGLLKAEILQPAEEHFEAEPYKGFSMEECEAVEGRDEFSRVLKWNGSEDISSLKGKKVYVRFYIRNSTLYTFRVVKGL